jgi:hypothetical protein
MNVDFRTAHRVFVVCTFLSSCGGKGLASPDSGRDAAAGSPIKQTDLGIGGNSGDFESIRDASAVQVDAPATSSIARDANASDRAYLPDPPDGGMPACVWSLIRPCCGSPKDICLWQNWDSGVGGATLCWPTGESTIVDDRARTITSYNSDKSVCYTQKPIYVSSRFYAMGYYDSSGTQVATWRYLEASADVEVTCSDGTTYIGTPRSPV